MPAQHQIAYPSAALQPYISCYLDVTMGQAGLWVSKLLPAKLEQCIFVSTGTLPVVTHMADKKQDMLYKQYYCNVRGGVSSSVLQLQLTGQLSMFVILFRPGGFFRLLGVPPALFQDAFIPAALSIGSEWEDMGQLIVATPGMQDRKRIAEQYLYRQLKRDLHISAGPMENLVEHLCPEKIPTVQQWARQSFLSERQFRRKFEACMGLSPQQYLRIYRSRQAIRMRQLQPQRSWRSIAFELGYTDQSHFNREMKALADIQSLPVTEQYLQVQDTPFRTW